MGVAVKRLRIGRRRSQAVQPSSPFELATTPALVEDRWKVPDRFNFTRDVVEALAQEPKRRALMFSGRDGIIEPRTFLQLAEGGAAWATLLRERGVGPGDRVLVLLGSGATWLEVVLGCIKAGAVTVPCSPHTSAPSLEALVAGTGAALVVADRASDGLVSQLSFTPDVQHVDDAALERSTDALAATPTHDTSSRDVAFVLSATRPGSEPRLVAHTHGAAFATRVQAEHWLDASRGDAVWCTAHSGSAQAVWTGLLGPWARGAELVLHEDAFDAQEQLDLIHRLGVTILCQTPAEYRALAELPRRDLERYQSRRLRRLVSTGDYLEPDVVAVFEEAWGITVHDGYGQAETNVVVANGADAGYKPGSLGVPLPGHHVSVVDAQGNELPPGIEGELAVRGRPPSLFAGYWESPEETKQAFAGDWYLTGDVAVRDDEGFYWFVGQADDVIASRGRTFGPHEVERVLREHETVLRAAVVGVRDLERGGHFVRAFVVLDPRARATEQLGAELRQHVADVLPEQHVPREVEFIDALPTTASGKIRRDELRERPVVARPHWEPAPTATIVETPQPTVVAPEPVAAVPEPIFAPPPDVLEPVVETFGEPVAETTFETYEPVQPPVTAEPVPEASSAPEAEAPVAAGEPETPAPTVHFEPVHEPVAEPVAEAPAVADTLEPAEAALAPKIEAEPATPVEPEPAPVPEVVLEPVVEPEPGPAELAGSAVEPAAEPTPERAPEVEVEVEPEPAPLPEYIVPPSSTPEPVVVPPEPEPEEPDLGPLPDYILDPDRPRPLEPVPAPTLQQPEIYEPPAPEPEDPLAGLGLKPVTEFPTVESSPERSAPAGRRRLGAAPRSGKVERPSENEPGDEAEEIGWMQGLSNRLSAYSLDAEPSASESSTSDDDAEAEQDDAERA
jgi:acetyl-CoA synthetase/medium-chain acyl-CoA synthetase